MWRSSFCTFTDNISKQNYKIKKKIYNLFLFALKLHTNVVQSMTRIQQVQLAAETLAAVTIHQNQHVPDVVAVDAAQHLVQVAAIHRHRCRRLLKHVDRIHDSEKIEK